MSVAPFAGAWIETLWDVYKNPSELVAPFAGAWIETFIQSAPFVGAASSLPSRERGLKLRIIQICFCDFDVAPFAGAWIETYAKTEEQAKSEGRSLRGSVD